jgi:phosphoribosylanthranilate isomerase
MNKENMKPQKSTQRPQVKICGINRVEHAVVCAELGADAIGCIFFPKSPRHLTDNQARDIVSTLPCHVKATGVFVNPTFNDVIRKVEYCGLNAIQLHGQESPDLVSRLSGEGLPVIKALFMGGDPPLTAASQFDAAAFLVECAGGPLPGGNALDWDWSSVRDFGEQYPLVLAGGLSADNICRAVEAALPDVVDVSSGVEASPGRKDTEKIKSFFKAIDRCGIEKAVRKVY